MSQKYAVSTHCICRRYTISQKKTLGVFGALLWDRLRIQDHDCPLSALNSRNTDQCKCSTGTITFPLPAPKASDDQNWKSLSLSSHASSLCAIWRR